MESLTRIFALTLLFLRVAFCHAADTADISNGIIHAKLLLPDPEHGYYRGSRFDWSGVIESLTYKGHNYFGKWFEGYDPTLHDTIMGPVEEFRGDEGALGYNEAQPGRYFIKIGVGILRKPDDQPYNFARRYEIANGGMRVVRPEADRVYFSHELNNGDGTAYLYQKVVRLVARKPELIIEHSLKNTGHKVIETSVYNHDFYVIDGQPTGPDFHVKFAFKPTAPELPKDAAEINGSELLFKRELQIGADAASPLTGFGSSPKENDIVVENRKVGAGVEETGDQPLARVYFWSIRTTVCPEAYIHMKIEPGKTFKWRIVYRFYTFKP